MMQKTPKLYLENRDIVPLARKQRKAGLSSIGRQKGFGNIQWGGPIKLNRSVHWDHANSYPEARKIAIDAYKGSKGKLQYMYVR